MDGSFAKRGMPSRRRSPAIRPAIRVVAAGEIAEHNVGEAGRLAVLGEGPLATTRSPQPGRAVRAPIPDQDANLVGRGQGPGIAAPGLRATVRASARKPRRHRSPRSHSRRLAKIGTSSPARAKGILVTMRSRPSEMTVSGAPCATAAHCSVEMRIERYRRWRRAPRPARTRSTRVPGHSREPMMPAAIRLSMSRHSGSAKGSRMTSVVSSSEIAPSKSTKTRIPDGMRTAAPHVSVHFTRFKEDRSTVPMAPRVETYPQTPQFKQNDRRVSREIRGFSVSPARPVRFLRLVVQAGPAQGCRQPGLEARGWGPHRRPIMPPGSSARFVARKARCRPPYRENRPS